MDDQKLSASPLLQQASHSRRPDDDGDYDLLRRISCADSGALEQLYFKYHNRLVKFLFHVIRCQTDLEQVISDTFLMVWQHAADFRGESRVSTWIFGIAYRRALKSIRISSAPARDAPPEVWEGAAVVEDAVNAIGNGQVLELGIRRLPPEQRLVLVLAYCMDYSCEETAAILACSVNTVRSRMGLARRKLRAITSSAAPPHPTFVGALDAPLQTEGLDLL